MKKLTLILIAFSFVLSSAFAMKLNALGQVDYEKSFKEVQNRRMLKVVESVRLKESVKAQSVTPSKLYPAETIKGSEFDTEERTISLKTSN